MNPVLPLTHGFIDHNPLETNNDVEQKGMQSEHYN